MKIALYTGTFVRDKDGVARTLFELVNCIKNKGHKVKVWSPDVAQESSDENVDVRKLSSVPVLVYPDYKVGFFGPRTKKELDDFKPDIIHISTPDLVGREFLQYGKRNNIPAVSVYHTDFPSYLKYYQLGALTPPMWGYLRWFYNNSVNTLVPTRAMEKRLISKGINNTFIWSRGIKGDLFSPGKRSEKIRQEWKAEKRKVILYSGRFVWYKDLKTFIKVYEELVGLKDDVKFVLLGSGPAEKELKESMPEAVFPGYLKDEKLAMSYASGDIFFFPSTTETFGNVVQEALASGLPSVVSNVGGCKEIIKQSNGGLISNAKDPGSFTKNIERLLDDEDLYNSLRENGLEFAKKRSWRYVNEQLLEKYEEISKMDHTRRDPMISIV